MKIQDTEAYKKMDAIQQKVTLMTNSRKQIYDNVEILKTIGLELWEQRNNLPVNRWKNIVKELAAV